VDLTVIRPSGRVEKLAHRRPGEAFGEMSVLNDAPRSAAATASEATILLRVDQEQFWELLSNNQLALRVLASLAKALNALDLRFAAQERIDARKAGGGGVDMGEMSRLLQRGLMPAEAPRIGGFDIAAGTNLVEDGPGIIFNSRTVGPGW
jgi:CRP-like cAMP-binding protein